MRIFAVVFLMEVKFDQNHLSISARFIQTLFKLNSRGTIS